MRAFQREELKDQLRGLQDWKLRVFALLCADRIRGAYWAFSEREGREMELQIFEKCRQYAWANLIGP